MVECDGISALDCIFGGSIRSKVLERSALCFIVLNGCLVNGAEDELKKSGKGADIAAALMRFLLRKQLKLKKIQLRLW